MANVKKALYNVAVFLVSLFITGSINVSNIKNTQDTSRVTLTVNETETLQEMNGWGAAAAWWAQVAGGSKNADDIAKLLYSKEGLGCFPNKKILRNSPCLPACKQKNIATRLRDTT